MPPHLKKFYKPSCVAIGCPKDAQHTLYNEVNDKIADYCDKHATQALARAMQDFEKRLTERDRD